MQYILYVRNRNSSCATYRMSSCVISYIFMCDFAYLHVRFHIYSCTTSHIFMCEISFLHVRYRMYLCVISQIFICDFAFIHVRRHYCSTHLESLEWNCVMLMHNPNKAISMKIEPKL